MDNIIVLRNAVNVNRDGFRATELRSRLADGILSKKFTAVLNNEQGLTVEAAFDLFVELRSQGYRPGHHVFDSRRGESWRRSSLPMVRTAQRAWMAALGNPLLVQLERKRAVRGLIDIRERPKTARRPVRAALGAQSPSHSGVLQSVSDRLAPETCRKYLRTARQVGELMVDLDLVKTNPFDISHCTRLLTNPRHAEDASIKAARNSQAVQSYLSSSIFQRAIEDPGEPLFWVPLLMRLAGLRVSEAVGLRTADVVHCGGIPVIRIEGDDEKSLPVRDIPVPARLRELGFLSLCDLRRGQNTPMLFPLLSVDRQDKAVGRFRKRFVRYCGNHGIDCSQLKSDCFRRALQNDLVQRGSPSDVVRMVTGRNPERQKIVLSAHMMRLLILKELSEVGKNVPGLGAPFR